MSQSAQCGYEARTLRAWHLALLRFAVTMDDADRSAVLAIAVEIDKLGGWHGRPPSFGFFRNTSTALCAAISNPSESTSAVLLEHLARIDDERLKRTFAAAIETKRPGASLIGIPKKRNESLWRGLSSRDNHQR